MKMASASLLRVYRGNQHERSHSFRYWRIRAFLRHLRHVHRGVHLLKGKYIMAKEQEFQAVILDECGQEFGVTVYAPNHAEAYDKVREDYPENRGVLQMENAADRRAREQDLYERISKEDDDPGLAAWEELCEQEGW